MSKIIENRLFKLRKIMIENKIDTFMVLIDVNRRYLSGFISEDAQFNESAGALFITADKLVLATDSRFELQAMHQAPLFNIICYRKGLIKSMPEIFCSLGTKQLGFESDRLSYKQYQEIKTELKKSSLSIKLVPTENIVEKQRMIKTEAEISATRRALLLAEDAFRKVAYKIRPGMTEIETAWKMEKMMREAGAKDLAFPMIVASGPNGALPHAVPGKRKFNIGEPILFDFGARLDGYCSDTSRTLIIGKPDKKFNKIYQIVLDAQQKAISAIKDGVDPQAVDKIARDYINSMGFKNNFGHGLGHGTGLVVHEQPVLSPLSNTRLTKGMLITVEPGIYLPDWGGIRIENQVVVRQNNAEVLNTLDPAKYIIEI